MANTAGHPAGTAGGREVLAFDLYGTLVDPIAIAGELGQLLGDADGREAAGRWRATAVSSTVDGAKGAAVESPAPVRLNVLALRPVSGARRRCRTGARGPEIHR
jgi:hypothetical protein